MFAVLGVLIIASTVLLFTLAVLTARRPSPPGWIVHELSMGLIAIAFTSGIATGAAIILRHLSEFHSGVLGAAEAGMLLVVLPGPVLIRRMLRVREALSQYVGMLPPPTLPRQAPPPPATPAEKGPRGPTR